MRCIIGRSVETISGAEVLYFDCTGFDNDGYDWSDMQENIMFGLIRKYGSLTRCTKWAPYPYRENAILLENDHVQISISEYCGCGAISIFLRDEFEWGYYPELAEYWLKQNAANMLEVIEQFVDPLRRVGTFSNGCGVFEKK